MKRQEGLVLDEDTQAQFDITEVWEPEDRDPATVLNSVKARKAPFAIAMRCPHCRVVAQIRIDGQPIQEANFRAVRGLVYGVCTNCTGLLVYLANQGAFVFENGEKAIDGAAGLDLIFPTDAPVPGLDKRLPVQLQADYIEARSMAKHSARGSLGLTRMLLESVFRAADIQPAEFRKRLKEFVRKYNLQRDGIEESNEIGLLSDDPPNERRDATREQALAALDLVSYLIDIAILAPIKREQRLRGAATPR